MSCGVLSLKKLLPRLASSESSLPPWVCCWPRVRSSRGSPCRLEWGLVVRGPPVHGHRTAARCSRHTESQNWRARRRHPPVQVRWEVACCCGILGMPCARADCAPACRQSTRHTRGPTLHSARCNGSRSTSVLFELARWRMRHRPTQTFRRRSQLMCLRLCTQISSKGEGSFSPGHKI
jgi:hypothetical protein